MPLQDNQAILRLRNEASLLLDDLVTEVVNSTLAMELRDFSSELVEMQPGFAFSLWQAQTLKQLAVETLDLYSKRKIHDEELTRLVPLARRILQGENIPKGYWKYTMGGEQAMPLLDRLFHGSKKKKAEALKQMELEYSDICKKILALEREKASCIEKSQNCPPDSMAYRNNELKFNEAAANLKLLRNQEAQLRTALENAQRLRGIEEFNEQQKALARSIQVVLGNSDAYNRMIAEMELQTGSINEQVSTSGLFVDEFFSRAETHETPRAESEFSALVAESARRHQETAETLDEAKEPEKKDSLPSENSSNMLRDDSPLN